MEKIYVLKQNKFMYGPLTYLQIKAKGLRDSDQIWYEGMSDWLPATNIAEFKELVRTTNDKISSSSFFTRLFKF
ncbi:MAG: DUF4339 domain-containing protein [Deinococcales bacterium]|nr:DUF4339 domain-containing protein [Chitinophagaceae bacterium]